jgi:23S rRNA pseudouridine955/2504/2580 synthase
MARAIFFPSSEKPKRLETFLRRRFPMGYVRKLFRKKAVRLNGRPARPAEKAQPGDKIDLFIPFVDESDGKPRTRREPGFEIVHEDASLLIVNKAAGLAVHEGKEILKRSSLIGLLEERYRKEGVVPRLVHRIDKETSGLLVVAKSEEEADRLKKLFADGAVEKDYLALVVGRLNEERGTIDLPLPGRSGELAAAATEYRIERNYESVTLVRARTRTGRMHQVRLHFAKVGHPLVMDDRYGNFAFNRRFRKAFGLKRQFLHAARLAWNRNGKRESLEAPLPEDLASTLRRLGETAD